MNPKERQKQVARLLVSDSVPIGPAPVRPSSESEIRPPVRRLSDEDEGEETRDKEKEKEQDEEEKVMRDQKRVGEEGGGRKRKKTKVEVDLKFSKENVPSGIARSSSPLSAAIQQKLGESEVKKQKKLRVTVFLPATDSQRERVVQFELDEVAPAKSLIQAALNAYLKDQELVAKDPIPSDYSQYRIYIAEEDGEVDTDLPALDEDCTIASTGVVHFALRKKETQSGYSSDIDVTLDTSVAPFKSSGVGEVGEVGGKKDEEKKEKRISKSKKGSSKKLPLGVNSSSADNNNNTDDDDGSCKGCCCVM